MASSVECKREGLPLKNGSLKACPYWRRVAVCGNRILVLCGKKSLDEQPSSSDMDGLERLPLCKARWGSDGDEPAYYRPAIMEWKLNEEREWWRGEPSYIKDGYGAGPRGVRCLEELWEEELNRFIERWMKAGFLESRTDDHGY